MTETKINRRGLIKIIIVAGIAAGITGCQKSPDTNQAGSDSNKPADVKLAASGSELPKTLSLDLGEGVKMDLVLIPAGEFLMGSSESEKDRDADEGPQHRVRITKPFYMGKYEVTQAQWQAVIGVVYSVHNVSGELPVKNDSWDDCQEFCRKLSQKFGREIRLPTEAEWEYACRAGTTTAYSFGDSPDQLDQYAWFNCGKINPVGVKKPNAWGLHDMHGNVWEWCQDWYDKYPNSTVTRDDFGQKLRVLRGGSFVNDPTHCRTAFRGGGTPDDRYIALRGLRVVSPAGDAAGGR